MIRCTNVSKSFRGKTVVQALEKINLQIHDGEFVSIIGPSGCGKSTLLRIVAGLIERDGGEVLVAEQRVQGPHPDVGVVFQTSNLLPWMTVEQNIRLAAKLRGMPKSEAQARLGEVMPTLGLDGFERSYPYQLSGGMQQRTALGQALLLSPRVLLLDEPFGALDALTRDRLNVELLRIWEKNKQTLLLITHSITEAVFLSDRVLVMSQRPGQLVHELRIDLPRPRHTRHTRSTAQFGAYLGRLSELMGIE